MSSRAACPKAHSAGGPTASTNYRPGPRASEDFARGDSIKEACGRQRYSGSDRILYGALDAHVFCRLASAESSASWRGGGGHRPRGTKTSTGGKRGIRPPRETPREHAKGWALPRENMICSEVPRRSPVCPGDRVTQACNPMLRAADASCIGPTGPGHLHDFSAISGQAQGATLACHLP